MRTPIQENLLHARIGQKLKRILNQRRIRQRQEAL